jgi:hypothetical protein
MNVPGLRSPREKVGGICYIGRMFDKIRLHAAGRLPSEFQANLGTGFDGRGIAFLWIDYPALVEHVKAGGDDDEIIEWCFSRGRRPSEEEIEIWNDFMRKRGWRDEVSAKLMQRKAEGGFEKRDDIQTMFDYIDLDEGRDPNSR